MGPLCVLLTGKCSTVRNDSGCLLKLPGAAVCHRAEKLKVQTPEATDRTRWERRRGPSPGAPGGGDGGDTGSAASSPLPGVDTPPAGQSGANRSSSHSPPPMGFKFPFSNDKDKQVFIALFGEQINRMLF